MAELCNLTPFAATTLPSMSFDDRQLMVAVVAGRFHMPLPRSHHREPTISEFQPPVPLADEWRGPPGASSLNTGGGILVDGGGSLVLTNSFVGGSADSPALRVNDGTFELLYVTVGLPTVLGGPALECTDGSSSMMRNSLITSVHADPEVDCPNLTVSTSALEMSLGDNVSLGDMDVGWFDGYLAGDYHLSGTHPPAIDTAATWLSGDPTTDIDGDPRPTTDQSPDVAGADIP